MTPSLIIDPEFRDLIPPLSAHELENLEESLLREGCREPIVVWNQMIIDGHHRYEICKRHNLPFGIKEVHLLSREDAVSWICLTQLGRRNLSEEAYRYLIGKRYDAEKIINQRKNAGGFNQFNAAPTAGLEMIMPEEKRRMKEQYRTSVRLGNEYRLDHATIESYGRFSRSLDEVERKAPGLRRDVLSGAIRISKTRIDQMAGMPEDDVQAVSDKLRNHMRKTKHVSLQDSAHIIKRLTARDEPLADKPVIVTGIKQMPEHDPDAEINGLLLTAPTWIRTIQRLTENTDFQQVSDQTRRKLLSVLRELESAVSGIQHKAGSRDNGY